MVFLRGLNLRLPLCCTVHIATSWFRSRMAEGDSSTKRGKLQTEHVPPDAHRSGQESKILNRGRNSVPLPPGEDGARFARRVRAPAFSSMPAPPPDARGLTSTSPEGRGKTGALPAFTQGLQTEPGGRTVSRAVPGRARTSAAPTALFLPTADRDACRVDAASG